MIFINYLKRIIVFYKLVGSDQWGNIINGVELIRKMLKKEAFGITSPLNYISIWIKNGKN